MAGETASTPSASDVLAILDSIQGGLKLTGIVRRGKYFSFKNDNGSREIPEYTIFTGSETYVLRDWTNGASLDTSVIGLNCEFNTQFQEVREYGGEQQIRGSFSRVVGFGKNGSR